ncbi:interleukin-23 receptor precursor [Mus musculus]|uniref:Interleukin-23 receptor n=2 Tax=Mus musculus TaxID=10090 RepID=IL23R_MOUSE|nr:interleukin-23 receptor precursor [Mus musculus]Q8K4B4.1 RecName: Full=Interleukin-23 receptor; Short=IL-23 receptor; Short=IL-23R; Flags: Precursor [Mus musculus]AAI12426.1 Interleukin 23 receptor [Mus musculus]AAM44230.1 interleukin-23 receptor [Mus musculus]
MSHLTLQLHVVIALYVLFRWCHGGITSINCSGDMWVEPGEIFQMGMNVSIYCQEALKHCRPRNLYFYKNGFKEEFDITRINRTTARIWYKGFSEPHAYMHCTAECPGHFQETLICGKDISSGHPPDAPSNLTCVIYEYSGNMTCTWNTGKPTYIDTKYIVHVKSLETEEEQQYLASSYVKISTDSLQGSRKYLVWVQAVNSLGMENSQQLHVHLDDIVIPSASIISRAETTNDTVPKTIVYWKSKTMIEKVFCEMRYKTTTNQTWSVKEFDANFTYVQQSEFYLEPDSKYVFQVRCQETGKRNWQPWSSPFVHQTSQETGKRNWQPWSSPFVHQTSQTVSQVTAKSSHEPQKMEMLSATIFRGHPASGNHQDIGLLSGMVFLAIMLPIFSLIGIFNRSLRIGIKRKVLLMIPKWLYEDIPNMENSNVAKLLQEKSVFENDNASEQALYVDPVLTEISEISPLEHKPTDYKEERLTGLLETRDCPLGMLSTSSSVVYIPDLNTGYKPQVSNVPPGGNLFINRDERDPTSLETTDDHFARLKTYPNFQFSASSMALLNKTLILDELCLVLNQGEFNSLDIKNSRQEETSIVLQSDSPSETIPAQTLLSDEFVSCLAIGNEDLPSINSYFPQNVLESHFSRISLFQK